jgi:hypothetical protein
MKNGLVNVICAMALLSGCPTSTPMGTDSGPVGPDTGPVGGDAGPPGCTGSDGLPCLAVGSATATHDIISHDGPRSEKGGRLSYVAGGCLVRPPSGSSLTIRQLISFGFGRHAIV